MVFNSPLPATIALKPIIVRAGYMVAKAFTSDGTLKADQELMKLKIDRDKDMKFIIGGNWHIAAPKEISYTELNPYTLQELYFIAKEHNTLI